MMKKFIYLIVLIVSIYSCQSFLDTEPENMLTSQNVFENENSIRAFFATLYHQMPMEDFQFGRGAFQDGPNRKLPGGYEFLANLTHEAMNKKGITKDSYWESVWPYAYLSIGNVNNFLKELESVKETLEEEDYMAYKAEALFIRAYTYFELAKFYGAVPIILQTQEYEGQDSSLWIARSSEEAVFDQIKEDLDFGMAHMRETSEYGRANSYVAAALKSRAMLYAASIAKNGTPDDLDGLLGIPAGRADEFYDECIAASDTVIQSEKYELFNRIADKSENFQKLFLTYQGNSEIILARGYDPLIQAGHSYNMLSLAPPWTTNYGGRNSPDFTLVNMFEKIDGTPWTLVSEDENGFIARNEIVDFFEGMDPRFQGTFLVPGTTFRGLKITQSCGVYHGGKFKKVPKNQFNKFYDPETKQFVDYNTGTIGSGNSGGTSSFDGVLTFGFCKKYVDIAYEASQINSNGTSYSHWLDLRYAEILLNSSEALFERGRATEALIPLNLVRERAGIRELTEDELNFDRIKNERFVELALENKSFWDYKRWRTLVDSFNNYRGVKAEFYWSVEQGGFINDGFGSQGKITYLEKHYYAKVPQSEMNLNPLLIQNPGY